MPLVGTLGVASAKGLGFTGASSAPIDNIAISLSLSGAKLFPMSVAADSSGNIFVAARQDDLADGSSQYVHVLKYNSAGVIQWKKQMRWTNGSTQFANRTWVGVNGLVVGASGNIYVGFGQAVTAGLIGWIVKLNTSGSIVWQQSYRGASNSSMTITALAINSAETALYAAGFPNVAAGAEFTTLANISPTDGSISWSNSYYGAEYGGWQAITIQANGNLSCIGRAYIGSYSAMVAVQFNSSGSLQWQRQLTTTGSQHFQGWGIASDSSNNIYLAYGFANGFSNSSIFNGGGGVLKVANDATEVAHQRGFNDAPAMVAGTTAGDLYGWSWNSSSSQQLVRWNSSLTEQWTTATNAISPADSYPRGVSLGTAAATTFLGATSSVNGSDIGGVVYRLLRTGTGTGGGNKVASPFTVSYTTATANKLSGVGTYATRSGSMQANNFILGALTVPIADSAVVTNTVAL